MQVKLKFRSLSNESGFTIVEAMATAIISVVILIGCAKAIKSFHAGRKRSLMWTDYTTNMSIISNLFMNEDSCSALLSASTLFSNSQLPALGGSSAATNPIPLCSNAATCFNLINPGQGALVSTLKVVPGSIQIEAINLIVNEISANIFYPFVAKGKTPSATMTVKNPVPAPGGAAYARPDVPSALPDVVALPNSTTATNYGIDLSYSALTMGGMMVTKFYSAQLQVTFGLPAALVTNPTSLLPTSSVLPASLYQDQHIYLFVAVLSPFFNTNTPSTVTRCGPMRFAAELLPKCKPAPMASAGGSQAVFMTRNGLDLFCKPMTADATDYNSCTSAKKAVGALNQNCALLPVLQDLDVFPNLIGVSSSSLSSSSTSFNVTSTKPAVVDLDWLARNPGNNAGSGNSATSSLTPLTLQGITLSKGLLNQLPSKNSSSSFTNHTSPDPLWFQDLSSGSVTSPTSLAIPAFYPLLASSNVIPPTISVNMYTASSSSTTTVPITAPIYFLSLPFLKSTSSGYTALSLAPAPMSISQPTTPGLHFYKNNTSTTTYGSFFYVLDPGGMPWSP